MPKHTKRQKIRAEQHRSTTIQHPIHASPVAVQESEQQHSTFSYQYANTTSKQHNLTPQDNSEFNAIKTDLIKTVVLASIAIAVELILRMKIGA